MHPNASLAWTGAALIVLASAAVVDLHRVEGGSLVIYTTPALRDYIEKQVVPAWLEQGGIGIQPVYITAGEQYSRLRMAGGANPEADLFMHASPLYLEKAYGDGFFEAVHPTAAADMEGAFLGRDVPGGHPWVAFAWSPVVEVYSPWLGAAPDLATTDVRVGLPHPILSNNGIYAALLLDAVSPEAGDHVRGHTVVQPVNARTNIIGVADGSFHVTLGYEGVAKFYQAQGAKIAFDAPLIDGQRATIPVLFSAGVVMGGKVDVAHSFIDFLLTPAMQAATEKVFFRPVVAAEAPREALAPVEVVDVDWSEWERLDDILPRYEVR